MKNRRILPAAAVIILLAVICIGTLRTAADPRWPETPGTAIIED